MKQLWHWHALILGLLCLAPAISRADDSILARIDQANAKYNQGDFADAEELYKEAISEGANNGHLAYNLANAQYRQKKYGHAISNYRRALAEFPRDREIRANLDLARKGVKDNLSANSSPSLLQPVLVVFSSFSVFEWRLGTLVAAGIFWGILVLALWTHSAVARWGASITGAVAAVMVIFCLTLHTGRDGLYRFSLGSTLRPGVVTATEARAYFGDAETFQVAFVLHEGAEVDVAQMRNGWVQVILPQGQRGWVRWEQIEVL